MSEHQATAEAQGMEATRGDPRPELRRLVELSTHYPDIGPTVAELAYKVGCADIGDQVVKLGLEGERPGVEFYFVRAHAARRSGDPERALAATTDALEAFTGAPEGSVTDEEASRLLHLVRLSFAVLMFDLKDIGARPEFSRRLAELLPQLEDRLGQDPFYRSLLAQAYWFEDRERSEAEWERAAAIDSTEFTWNARGTWYKEAERDPDKAEATYRRGLEAVPQSALLLHNVAQLLVDRAEARKDEAPGHAHKLLGEAEELLRAALREEAAKVRRHIHSTRDRLHALRRGLPKPGQKSEGAREATGRKKRGNRGGRGREVGKGEGEKPARQDGARQDGAKAKQGGGGKSGDGEERGKPKEGQKPSGQGRRRGRGRGDREKQKPDFQTDGRIRLGDVLMSKLKDKGES